MVLTNKDQVYFAADEDLKERLTKFCKSLPGLVTRAEAIRLLLNEALTAKGFPPE